MVRLFQACDLPNPEAFLLLHSGQSRVHPHETIRVHLRDLLAVPGGVAVGMCVQGPFCDEINRGSLKFRGDGSLP